jgi:hypothetical protein
VPFPPKLTSDDLDAFGSSALGAADPLAMAAELVAVVEQQRLADPADTGYALMLAAEITADADDLAGALALADRAVDAHRPDGDGNRGSARAFRATLLLRLGREDEGLAELARLRRLLTTDAAAVSYVSEALEAGGRAEIAEQWLTAALESALDRQADLSSGPDESAYRGAGMIAYTLTQHRHRIRRDLDLPHDAHDDLADRLRDAVHGLVADAFDDAGDAAALFWPQVEFDRLLIRWPALTGVYGSTWQEHRDSVERHLQTASRSGATRLAVLSGRVDDLARHASRIGGDPTDADVRGDYTDSLPPRRWPPGRNEACWCGSGAKYKKCCLSRARD